MTPTGYLRTQTHKKNITHSLRRQAKTNTLSNTKTHHHAKEKTPSPTTETLEENNIHIQNAHDFTDEEIQSTLQNVKKIIEKFTPKSDKTQANRLPTISSKHNVIQQKGVKRPKTEKSTKQKPQHSKPLTRVLDPHNST
jgi:hypothetical protein